MPVQRPRFREQSSLRYLNRTVQAFNVTCTSGAGSVTTSVTPIVVGEYRSMDDWVTDGFKRYSIGGEVINNRMKQHLETHVATAGTFNRRYTGLLGCQSPNDPALYYYQVRTGPFALIIAYNDGLLAPRSLLTQSEIDELATLSATKVWSKSNQHVSQSMVDLAEMKKTVALLREPVDLASRKADAFYKFAKPLTRRISAAKKIGVMAGRTWDMLMQRWLAYRYGVRPLVSSINNTLGALGQYTDKVYRHTHRSQFSKTRTEVITGSIGDSGTTFGYEITYTDTVTVSAGGLFEDRLRQNESLGMDASSMLGTAWELVPLSFVVDWIVNVGAALEGLSAFIAREPLAGWTKTVRTRTVSYRTLSCTGTGSYTVTTPIYETYTGTFTDTYRHNGLAVPSIAIKPNAVESVLADARLVDSVALLSQKLARIKGLRL